MNKLGPLCNAIGTGGNTMSLAEWITFFLNSIAVCIVSGCMITLVTTIGRIESAMADMAKTLSGIEQKLKASSDSESDGSVS